MTFLDTNVLVYVLDVRDARKRRTALSIVADANSSPDFVISAQVLNEFANVAMRKLGKQERRQRSSLNCSAQFEPFR